MDKTDNAFSGVSTSVTRVSIKVQVGERVWESLRIVIGKQVKKEKRKKIKLSQ
jgi:hypothetical protein